MTDRQRLTEVVHAEIEAVMKKHDVGGVVLVVSPESAAWLTVLPNWSGLQPDAVHGLRVQLSSRDRNAHDRAEATKHLIACIKDMCGDYANFYGRMFRQVKAAIEASGGVVEHVAFKDAAHRPDPMGGKVD